MTHTVASFNKAIKGTQFEKDLGDLLQINQAVSSQGYWNLVLSIRDVELHTKGLKINRFWKFTPVKTYFGCKGSATQVVEQLRAYRDYLKGKEA